MDRGRAGKIKDYGIYRAILVTGPQRSGTRIGAKIIAHDTGHAYIDENEFDVRKVELFREVVKGNNIVVQCPGMCRTIEQYSAQDVLIVLMRRAIKDIIASEKRVGWQTGPYSEYELYGIRRQVAKWYRGRDLKPISELKYRYWDEYQKAKIMNYIELEYESLSGHPLWIPAASRRHFEATQTR